LEIIGTMREERAKRIEQVAYKRQFDLSVLLENVHDAHNIGAVLRSCDAVGIREIFVLNNEPGLTLKNEKLIIGKNTAAGARKWVDIHYFTDTSLCFNTIRQSYGQIFGTMLDEHAVSLYDLKLTESVVLAFGNEHDGLTKESFDLLDGNFIIPQVGMVQSLNISVACAVSLYEAFRQRALTGKYDCDNNQPDIRFEALRQEYTRRHMTKYSGRVHKVIK